MKNSRVKNLFNGFFEVNDRKMQNITAPVNKKIVRACKMEAHNKILKESAFGKTE